MKNHKVQTALNAVFVNRIDTKGEMKMKRKCLNNIVLAFVLVVCFTFITKAVSTAQPSDYFEPIPKTVPTIKNNPVTPEKILRALKKIQ